MRKNFTFYVCIVSTVWCTHLNVSCLWPLQTWTSVWCPGVRTAVCVRTGPAPSSVAVPPAGPGTIARPVSRSTPNRNTSAIFGKHGNGRVVTIGPTQPLYHNTMIKKQFPNLKVCLCLNILKVFRRYNFRIYSLSSTWNWVILTPYNQKCFAFGSVKIKNVVNKPRVPFM